MRNNNQSNRIIKWIVTVGGAEIREKVKEDER